MENEKYDELIAEKNYHLKRLREIEKELGSDIKERRRWVGLVKARNEFFYLARQQNFTLTEIGEFLDTHHATVIHGIKCYKKQNKV